MKKNNATFRAVALAAGVLSSSGVQAVTAWYQPTPYPLKRCAGTSSCPGGTMPQDLEKVHIHDGWLNNFYPAIMTFQRDEKLRLGGWGDLYRTYFKIDLDGLPSNVTQAAIWLMPYASGGTPIDVNFYLVTGTWDTGMTWSTQPPATLMGWRAAPVANQWWGTSITSWYNNWKNGTSPNYGMRLDPRTTPVNNFDEFRSSRYKDFVTDQFADGKRPILQLDFFPPTGMPNFKLPLSGGASWKLTGEAGGYECMGENPWPDTTHQGSNYFSLDFSPTNIKDAGGSYIGSIPILAAAGGTVLEVGGGLFDSRGFYIVLNHGNGFLTRYIHFNVPAARANGTLLAVGNTVNQGDQIGIMGNGGTKDVHLHMNFWYGSTFSGGKNIDELTRTTMEGLLLKSYQTECSVDANGVPTNRIRYYHSANTPTGI